MAPPFCCAAVLLFISFLLASDFRLLITSPRFEPLDRLPEHWQFDVRVNIVRGPWPALGMPHERHSHVLDYAGFHQPGVEGVPKVLEEHRTNPSFLHRCLPRTPELIESVSVVREDQAAPRQALQQFDHACCQRNFPLLAASRFAVGYVQHFAMQVDVLAELCE